MYYFSSSLNKIHVCKCIVIMRMLIYRHMYNGDIKILNALGVAKKIDTLDLFIKYWSLVITDLLVSSNNKYTFECTVIPICLKFRITFNKLEVKEVRVNR